MQENKKIVVAVTGASGSVYAQRLFHYLGKLPKEKYQIEVVFSDTAKKVWGFELKGDSYRDLPFRIWENTDFWAPFASGSAGFDTLIVCPCTAGTMGRIAAGTADDLICRAADVMLKERKKLILALRETPFNLVHIRNMETITLAGGIICPASPSFYSNPSTKEEIVDTVVQRVLQLAEIEGVFFRWGASIQQ